MRLADYMREHGLSDEALAAQIDPALSSWAVRKWRYGQREPDALTMQRISEITSGVVALEDWAAQSVASASKRRAESTPAVAS